MRYSRLLKNIGAPIIGLCAAYLTNLLVIKVSVIREADDLNTPGIVLMIEQLLLLVLLTGLCLFQIYIIDPKTRLSIRRTFCISIISALMLSLLCSFLAIYVDNTDVQDALLTFFTFFIPFAAYISANLGFVYWMNYLDRPKR